MAESTDFTPILHAQEDGSRGLVCMCGREFETHEQQLLHRGSEYLVQLEDIHRRVRDAVKIMGRFNHADLMSDDDWAELRMTLCPWIREPF